MPRGHKDLWWLWWEEADLFVTIEMHEGIKSIENSYSHDI